MPAWLTVITVVKDDEAGLERTTTSLAACNLDGVEHLIVDGSVTPPPKALLTGTGARLLREPPRGIYAAMNAGLASATGAYAWFLNAGDEVASTRVLDRLRDALGDAVWAHAPVQVVGIDGVETITPHWDYARERARLFARGRFPAHQGTIGSTAALRSLGGFDESYRVAADYRVALGLAGLAAPVELPFPIARFHEGGTSTREWQTTVAEFHRARVEAFRPRGLIRAIEAGDTGVHWARLGAYRTVISPLRQRVGRAG